MVTLDKIARLAQESRFDAVAPKIYGGSQVNLAKVRALGDGTKHDVCASAASSRVVEGLDRIGNVAKAGVCHSFTHDGRCVSLFKTLFTNACGHQCNYCTNASGCDKRGKVLTYTPEELAKITLQLYRGNYIEGLFLSSGTGRNEDVIMEKMLDSVRLLRNKYKFQGYVHLKVLPGAQREYIKQAVELVDRVSINIEAPTKLLLDEISPTKSFANDILLRQRFIKELGQKPDLPAGQTTQFVVGAAGETDAEIFKRVLREYRELEVKRAYYSAFTPVGGTPFSKKEGQPLWREHRLYQMDWLHRVYEFPDKELHYSFDEEGFLENDDPKMAIAREFHDRPVDPNEASYEELLRVPGIGPKSAYRIVSFRKKRKIGKMKQLKNIGVVLKRASPFLKVGGWYDTTLDRWF